MIINYIALPLPTLISPSNKWIMQPSVHLHINLQTIYLDLSLSLFKAIWTRILHQDMTVN